jgi:hypothetical protein
MYRKVISGLLVAVWTGLAASLALAADVQGSSPLRKTAVSRSVKYLDINQIKTPVMNNGTYTRHPISGNADMEWPKGSGKYICYNAGIWIAGKVKGSFRTACADYNFEFQPGVILPNGQPDNPEKEEYRVYKIQRDYPEGKDLGDPWLDIDPWSAWPAHQGAPVNPDGTPKFYGDQQAFAVMNDLDQNLHSRTYNTPPMGVELQLLAFAYNRSGALGNTMFVQYTIINKGGQTIDSTYVGIWADVDLGDANDDLVGYDMNLGMGYVYNGYPNDAQYGSRPPAIGFDFFRGPMVPSPGDTVRLPDGTVYPNRKILGATSFVKYYNPHAIYRDPPYSAQGAEEVWNYMNGTQRDGKPWVNPITGQVTTFLNTGDPVTGTGWLSTAESPPADVRILTSSGMFTLAPGDTQVIVAGVVIGQGINRLSSVSVLRFYDKFAQAAYDAGFKVSSPPRPPQVTVTPLDREILLSWDSRSEDYHEFGYEFEGYNIYIGASKGGPWKRLATYDRQNGIYVVLDEQYDETTGLVLSLPVAFGGDTGLKYQHRITQDYEGYSLANGRTYYVAVTAYSVGTAVVPRVLESPLEVLEVTPHKPRPGTVIHEALFDTVSVAHTKGNAEAWKAQVYVPDPTVALPGKYKITINPDRTWNLLRNGQPVPGFTNVNRFGITPPEQLDLQAWLDSPVHFFVEFTGSFDQPKTFEPKWVHDEPPANPTLLTAITSYYREGARPNDLAKYGTFRKGTENPAVIYRPLEIRFTGVMNDSGTRVVRGGQMATWLFSMKIPQGKNPANPNPGSTAPFVVRIPFEVWDVGSTPAKQLNVAFVDRAQTLTDSLLVLTWSPKGECDVYIIATPYDENVHDARTDTNTTWVIRWTKNATWSTGDVIKLIFPKPLVPGVDEFEFEVKGVETGVVEDAKKRLDLINVYPNPYIGHTITEKVLHEEHVTFINLPEECTIRILAINGDVIKTIHHTGPSTTHDWNLRNENNIPVASGLYIAYIEVPKVGTKVIKMAVVFRQQRLRNL